MDHTVPHESTTTATTTTLPKMHTLSRQILLTNGITQIASLHSCGMSCRLTNQRP
jgi:hypothetical protein